MHYTAFSSVLSAVLLGRHELNKIVNTENCDGSLCSEFEGLNLRHRWLEDTSLEVVSYLTVVEIEAGVNQGLLLLVTVLLFQSCVVEDSKLGNQVSSIPGGVHGEGLWDNLKGLRELSDSELLTGSKGAREVIKVDGKRVLESNKLCAGGGAVEVALAI